MIKTLLEGAKGIWLEELLGIVWAYKKTVKTPTGEMPFWMTFGTEAVVPVEVGLTTLWTRNYDDEGNEGQLHLNLDRVDEVKEWAKKRMKNYQEKMAQYYNARVKVRHFNILDLVLWKVTLATKDPT